MKEQIYPKLLIISHNLYDTSNNIGKTLVSLLSGWPKDKIAQIYFRNDTPSFNYCSQYYCITDKDILKSAMTCRIKKAGNKVQSFTDLLLSGTENNLYTIGNHRSPFISFVRDNLWKVADWKTQKLENWLTNEVKPDLILFVPNDYCLAYRVALYVHGIVNKPIVPFYMDDAFYWKCHIKGIDNLRRKCLWKLALRIHEYSKDILTICDYMSEEYQELFKRKCWAFVNSVKIVAPRQNDQLHNPIVLTYLGNLHSNRWRSLVEIGESLVKIEKDNGITCRLHIYSGSILEVNMKKAFDSISTIEFKAAVPASQVRRLQLLSDILIHVEAFDERSVYSTRLSLSTKIPEYLSTGVPVFAYGPLSIASMRYLTDNNLSQVCYESTDLYDALLELITNKQKRDFFSLNGVARALQYHNIDNVSQIFQNLLIQY